VRMLVPRLDQEKGRGGANPLVLGHGDVELLEAGRDPAFAQDLQPLVADLERRADALDALVHLAEERLVAPDSLRPALHRGDPTAGTGLRLCVRGRNAGMTAAGLRLLRQARARAAAGRVFGFCARGEPWSLRHGAGAPRRAMPPARRSARGTTEPRAGRWSARSSGCSSVRRPPIASCRPPSSRPPCTRWRSWSTPNP